MKILRIPIVCALLSAMQLSLANDSDPIDRADTIHGKHLYEYANEWWQWAYSMPQESSPIRDRVGDKCDVNQEGPVWFLAGGFESSKISRACSIPAGKHVFFRVINMLYAPSDQSSTYTCDLAKESSALNNQYLKSFKVVVDGHEFVNPVFYRNASLECFDLLGKIPRQYSPPVIYPSATDGYWIMLKPMKPGSHRIWFTAQYDRKGGAYGTMIQNIEYQIEIKSP